MKLLVIVLILQAVLGLTLIALVATDNLPFTDDEANGAARKAPAPNVDRFDGAAAWDLLVEQVELGPRPAGSEASRTLAARLRELVPNGRYQPVPGGLQNVVGTVRGREPGYIVVGAHYDTKDLPDFVGANDGASGTAVVAELARTIKRPRHTIQFVFFDGEESPRDAAGRAIRAVRAARLEGRRQALRRRARDGPARLRGRPPAAHPARGELEPRAVAQAAGRRKAGGRGPRLPERDGGRRHRRSRPVPARGVPAIDLIDFDFPCWHQPCDDLDVVSERSLDAVGETVLELVRRL